MKLKEAIEAREKLRKYDELQAWRNHFGKDEIFLNSSCSTFGEDEKLAVFIPENIQQLILSAIDAEIRKFDGNRAPEIPTDEIKVGDIVKIKSNAPRKYRAGHAHAYTFLPIEVTKIESSEHVFAHSVDGFMYFDMPARYLEPYYSAEDVRRMEEDLQREKEQHLREHSGKENDDPIKNIADIMEEYRKGFAKISSELVEFDWLQYRAKLASKIAVAYAEKGRFAPDEIGCFAVRVANDVVDNLKKQSE